MLTNHPHTVREKNTVLTAAPVCNFYRFQVCKWIIQSRQKEQAFPANWPSSLLHWYFQCKNSRVTEKENLSILYQYHQKQPSRTLGKIFNTTFEKMAASWKPIVRIDLPRQRKRALLVGRRIVRTYRTCFSYRPVEGCFPTMAITSEM